MRLADIHVGQAVAVSANLKAKHLNVLGLDDDRERAAGQVREKNLPPLVAALALFGGLPALVADTMNRDLEVMRRRFHRGVVRDVGLWWGGRKAGVLVEVDAPKAARLLDGATTVNAVVPCSMVTDLDEAFLNWERRRLEQERRAVLIQEYMDARRAGMRAHPEGIESWLRERRDAR